MTRNLWSFIFNLSQSHHMLITCLTATGRKADPCSWRRRSPPYCTHWNPPRADQCTLRLSPRDTSDSWSSLPSSFESQNCRTQLTWASRHLTHWLGQTRSWSFSWHLHGTSGLLRPVGQVFAQKFAERSSRPPSRSSRSPLCPFSVARTARPASWSPRVGAGAVSPQVRPSRGAGLRRP